MRVFEMLHAHGDESHVMSVLRGSMKENYGSVLRLSKQYVNGKWIALLAIMSNLFLSPVRF